MNETLDDVLRRELREVADRLTVPPRPALRQAPSRAARLRRPLLVAAAVTLIAGLVAVLAVYGAGRSMQPAFPPTPTAGTTTADGFSLQLSTTPPRVLIADRPDLAVYDPAGESWSGRLRYNDDCECFVLLEDGVAGAVTIVAWLPGSVGFTEGGKRGIELYYGRRILEGAHLTGSAVRIAAPDPPPIDLPDDLRLRPGCLVIFGVE
ncbi:hypothetical protein [Microlunatus sp. GCM10028923]|uniref:hypothetical protein n=1 Tax=Microlunatus sp. GCM10028923 TaxID=3273400 RepID=UPI00361320F0